MTIEKIKSDIEEFEISYIRMQFSDMLGTIKNVEIPAKLIDEAIAGEVMFDGSSIEGFVRIKETDMFLIPDLSTWLVLDFEKSKYGRVARFICDVHDLNHTPFSGDPRSILKKTLAKMKSLGFDSFNVGFEPEFYLFKKDEMGRATRELTDHGGYFDQSPMDGSEDVRRDIVLDLQRLGFEMEASHHEVGPSQHEINFRFADALKACDNLQTFKIVVKNQAAMHNMHATFMAKPITGLAGSGLHTNCSLFADGKNVFYDENNDLELSATCYSFIAGVMHHARAITAITNPTVNSYKRIIPGYEAPCYVAWSPSNRSAFIRIPATRKLGTRIEVRSVDAMANPYLALSVILEAGLNGITSKMECPLPTYENLFAMTREERESAGIPNLPNNLYDAIKELRKDAVIIEAIGQHTFERFCTAKLKEWDGYRSTVHGWELEQYFDKY